MNETFEKVFKAIEKVDNKIAKRFLDLYQPTAKNILNEGDSFTEVVSPITGIEIAGGETTIGGFHGYYNEDCVADGALVKVDGNLIPATLENQKYILRTDFWIDEDLTLFTYKQSMHISTNITAEYENIGDDYYILLDDEK